MKKSLKRAGAVVVGLVAMVTVLAGCSTTGAQPDMIGVVVGDGGNTDADVHEIVWPGQTASISSNEDIYYFPSNSRNYVIENRDSGNVDRTTPATGYTSTGVPVNVEVTAFWTINQDEEVIRDKFWPYCSKYNCASQDPSQKNERAATDGWVSMLDNDMAPAIDATVREVLPDFDDSTWQQQQNWTEIETALSEKFNAHLRARTGFTDDIFCGSGDVSGWADPSKPGEGEFTCGPIRFSITSIEAQNGNLQDGADNEGSSEAQQEQNAAILEAAKAKYGENAGDILGILDIIKQCQAAGQTCTVIVGGNGNISVNQGSGSGEGE